MNTLTNYFDRIIENQKQIDYLFPKILQPPADKILIEKIESSLDFKFNSELIELYSFANGIELDTNEPIGKIGLIPNHPFIDLNSAVEFYKILIEFPDSFYNNSKNYKPDKKLFPFLQDGAGNFYWVDLNDNSKYYGKIFWTNSFGDEPDYKCNSLTKFFQVICECYETGIFFIDNDGYLDYDIDLFDEKMEKYNK